MSGTGRKRNGGFPVRNSNKQTFVIGDRRRQLFGVDSNTVGRGTESQVLSNPQYRFSTTETSSEDIGAFTGLIRRVEAGSAFLGPWKKPILGEFR